METVEIVEGRFVVDAAIIAPAFGIAPEETQGLMQNGTITSRSERGEGEDAGLFRLTFYHNNRAFRLTVNGSGEILKRASFDAPPAARRDTDRPRS